MDAIKQIQLADRDASNLLNVLGNFIGMTVDELQRAEKNEKAGKPIYPMLDNYTDLYLALNTVKDDAKRLLKDLQKQTGNLLYEDEIIDEM